MEKLNSKKENKTVVLGITGSIAAYKACEIISMLKTKGHNIKCIMSRDAQQFITPLTIETLTGYKVVTDMFELPEERKVQHIALAKEADCILVAPATANIIGKLASGIADDMITTTIWATKKPVLIAPAMNTAMYENSIIQEKIAYLKKHGYIFLGPETGRLACCDTGKGHIMPTGKIVNAVVKVLLKK